MKYYPICDNCAKGIGSECHVPQCIYCMRAVPPAITVPEFGIDISTSVMKQIYKELVNKKEPND